MATDLSIPEARREQKCDLSHDADSLRASNWIRGSVVSLTCMGCRLQTDDDGILSIGCSDPFADPSLYVGQVVTAKIASQDVLLSMPHRWQGNERWNRWKGRIVLVEARLITVKVTGEPWTLKSTATVFGLDRPPRTWDSVTIVIDPKKVVLMSGFDDSKRLRSHLLGLLPYS